MTKIQVRDRNSIVDPAPEQDEVDQWWRRQPVPPGIQLLGKLIAATGLVPTDHVNSLRASVLSTDPERFAAAARDFRALRDARPEIAEKVLKQLAVAEAERISKAADYAHLDLPAERIKTLADVEIAQNRAPPPLPQNPIEIPPPPTFPEQHNPNLSGEMPDERPGSLEQELRKRFPMPNVDPTEPVVPWNPDMPWLDPGPPFRNA